MNIKDSKKKTNKKKNCKFVQNCPYQSTLRGLKVEVVSYKKVSVRESTSLEKKFFYFLLEMRNFTSL